MIGRLQGIVVDEGLDGCCVLDVGGVGYEVFVPVRLLGKLPRAPEPATLHVHTVVREDALQLFGFPDLHDRSAFRALLSVSSIGPKLALAILGYLDAGQLAEAVARGDKASFKGIPGVGRKTVERLVLELKDKLPSVAPNGKSPPSPAAAAPASPTSPERELVANALIQMGYRRHEADTAVAKLPDDALAEPVEELLRRALSHLG